MRVTTEAGEELRHLLVDHRVTGHAVIEIGLLGCCWQFTVKQQVAGFEEVAMFSKLINRIAAIQQHAFIAIDICDLGFA